MKIKKIIIKTLIAIVIATIGLGSLTSFAANEKDLQLSYFRYLYSSSNNEFVKTNGYALNTTGNEGESSHPIYQILSKNNSQIVGTNLYCLNAVQGDTWNNQNVSTEVTYNQSLNLASQKGEIANLSNNVYSNIANSAYYKQIMYLLDNMYIPQTNLTDNQNLANKQALLERAGIRSNYILDTDETLYGYRYVAQEGYDYSNFVSNEGKIGYKYKDQNGDYIDVVLTDDMVQSVQQAAIWYFTNYKDTNVNTNGSTTYNAYLNPSSTSIINWLKTSNGTTNTNTVNWPSLTSAITGTSIYTDPSTGDHVSIPVGQWLQEQATVLYDYLVDSADKYASTHTDYEDSSNPLSMASSTTSVKEVSVSGANYYVVGPIKINKTSDNYTLENVILVNDSTSTGAYISDANGNNRNKTVQSVVGEDFYVSVPKAQVTGNSIQIAFAGNYKTTEKMLLYCDTKTEQPVVEVTPKNKELSLIVSAQIEKQFDLALRKRITKIVNSAGTIKAIVNENGLPATRGTSYVASDIAVNGTATYTHRKDPVVVEKGDVITYSLTIYNEGEIDGYASEIVDQLPKGLRSNLTTGSTVTSENGNTYTVTYDTTSNKITLKLTNSTPALVTAYNEGTSLSSDTILVQCTVEQEPVTDGTTKNYLTNIAYISEAYDKDGNKVTQDRNGTESKPSVHPNKDADSLNSTNPNDYKGDTSNPSVYDDTNNETYYKGQEDDDDFEKIVILPKQFDFSLQKYITKILSPNGASAKITNGRNEPTINTKRLAEGTATTAEYVQDKTPITVKHGDYVLYTLRVYNECETAGYVNKITDNIPAGLQFVYQKDNDGKTLVVANSDGTMSEIEVNSDIYNFVANNSFWQIDKTTSETIKKDTYNGESTISVTCDVKQYNGGTNKLLNPYDSSKDVNYNGAGLDYVDVTVALRVAAPSGTEKIIRNEAAVTEAEDTNGNKQDIDSLKDRDSQVDEWPGKDGDKNYQDDEDYDNVILEKVDLALTKFITAISDDIRIEDGEYLTPNGKIATASNPYIRQTAVDTTPLKNETGHDAIYTQVKTPLTIPEESYVLYNIRVYNEGNADVYAGEVTDYLPNYLDFVSCEFNDNYGWTVSSDGKTIKTSYLSSENGTDKILKAFDKESDDGKGSSLSYKDLQILVRVNSNAPEATNLINTAAITKYEDNNGNEIDEDIDSHSNEIPDEDKNKEKRTEDDDDWEVVNIKKKPIDLALTKFITAISEDITISDGEYLTKDTTSKNAGSESNPYTRQTAVDTTPLKDGTAHDAIYTQVKTPLTVPANSYILYNIRVYNEGETDAYAGEVADYLPNYLDYVSCEFNDNYKWTVDSDGKTIKTTYLSSENGTDKKLKAFDKEKDDGKGSGLSYKDLPILVKINSDAPSGRKMINSAEITKYENNNGEEVPKDVDSEPDNIPEKNVEKRTEDDDDYEVVEIKTFDLSLLKYVSTVYVTEDGKTTTTQTGNVGDKNDTIPKVEINRKKLNSTVVKFGYTIKITNEGDIAGYAKEITDYVPEGLKFYSEDNTGWKDEGNNVISTRLLENTLLQPGESASVKVIFRWINGSNNLGLKTNIAEISEDYNEEHIPDRDSTPDNKKEGEDDIDDAQVLLSISTGLVDNIIRYATYSAIILIVLGAGIIAIKKFVL